MRIIELSQGYIAVVSKEDYKRVKKHKWWISRSGPKGKSKKLGEPYAATIIDGKKVYLHRFIMGNPKGMIVDHINNQTLDCRRSNLRIVTHKENMENRIDNKKKYWRK